MSYQDRWVRGETVSRGERECAGRYALVREFCARYRRPFTVLDIGANLGYFCLRLTEDFRDCTAVAIERDPEIVQVLHENQAERVVLLRREMTTGDLERLGECEHFDVVLALSILHHFEGAYARRLQALQNLGDNVIIEFAHESAACGGSQKEFAIPEDAELLGCGVSHLDGSLRHIVLLQGMKTEIQHPYLGSDRELALTIHSNFTSKSVHFRNKDEVQPWQRGLNLWTYLQMGGEWPDRAAVARRIERHRDEIIGSGHNDVNPWNVILQGDDVAFIDGTQPQDVSMPTAEYFDRLLASVKGD